MMSPPNLHLSDRQQQLMALLSQGKSNKEIAYELGITEGTVKQQLFSLYRKLGVTSRTKAIVVGSQMARQAAATPVSQTAVQGTHSYLWKLLTTVAVHPLNEPDKQPAAVAQFDRALAQLRAQVAYLATLLDCHLLMAPGGGLLACFGTPRSHLDDSARALHFARLLALWHLQNKRNALAIGIGIATSAEIVAESDTPPIHAESFKLAQRLASEGEDGEIRVSEITCRLAGPLYPYVPLPQKTSSRASPRLLPPTQNVDLAKLAKRNPLPFMAEVLERFQQRAQADWISIESWPPSAGVRLMDAVSVHLEHAGLPVLRLRLPTAQDRTALASSVTAQIAAFMQGQMGPSHLASNASLLAALQALAQIGPHAICVYGVNSLASMLALLELHGVHQLIPSPLLIVVMRIHEDADAYVAARLLGPNPIAAGHTRVFKLALGTRPTAPNALDADLLTLIDSLSLPARQLARKIAEVGTVPYALAAEQARELLSCGLFMEEADSIRCRDQATANALSAHLLQQTS